MNNKSIIKVRIRKDVFLNTDWAWIDYNLFEGYCINYLHYKEMPSCYKLYFEFYGTQKEVVGRLQDLGVDTNW